VYENYTIDELEIHYEAALRRQAKETQRQATTIRIAQYASQKHFKEHMRKLDEVWKKIELAAGRSISTASSFFGGGKEQHRGND
jgi:hypothetical protein